MKIVTNGALIEIKAEEKEESALEALEGAVADLASSMKELRRATDRFGGRMSTAVSKTEQLRSSCTALSSSMVELRESLHRIEQTTSRLVNSAIPVASSSNTSSVPPPPGPQIAISALIPEQISTTNSSSFSTSSPISASIFTKFPHTVLTSCPAPVPSSSAVGIVSSVATITQIRRSCIDRLPLWTDNSSLSSDSPSVGFSTTKLLRTSFTESLPILIHIGKQFVEPLWVVLGSGAPHAYNCASVGANSPTVDFIMDVGVRGRKAHCHETLSSDFRAKLLGQTGKTDVIEQHHPGWQVHVRDWNKRQAKPIFLNSKIFDDLSWPYLVVLAAVLDNGNTHFYNAHGCFHSQQSLLEFGSSYNHCYTQMAMTHPTEKSGTVCSHIPKQASRCFNHSFLSISAHILSWNCCEALPVFTRRILDSLLDFSTRKFQVHTAIIAAALNEIGGLYGKKLKLDAAGDVHDLANHIPFRGIKNSKRSLDGNHYNGEISCRQSHVPCKASRGEYGQNACVKEAKGDTEGCLRMEVAELANVTKGKSSKAIQMEFGKAAVIQQMEGEERELQLPDGEVKDRQRPENDDNPQPMGRKSPELPVSNSEGTNLQSLQMLYYQLSGWGCQCAPGVAMIPVVSLKTKSRRDFPNLYGDDRLKISRLEGFVSNREQSYENPIEELLYAVVVASENATVAELGATSQADLSQLQAAASFACQLGEESHAVTLYEGGKLGHTCIGDLCKGLSTLEGAKCEGEPPEFANHAYSLRFVLECLLSGGVSVSVREVEGCDGMDLSSVPPQRSKKGAIRRKRNYYVDPLRCEEVDPLPSMLKQSMKRMVRWYILPPSCVPNSCIINIYDEGDCILPHIDHHDFLRPFGAVSFLSKCNILFGVNLKIPDPGEFPGPAYIPLPVGSVMILKGNGAELAGVSIYSFTLHDKSRRQWDPGEY